MKKDELSAAVLIGSYLQEISTGPMEINPKYATDVVSKVELCNVADELARYDLVEQLDIVSEGFVAGQNVLTCPLKITPKGRDILSKKGKGSPIPLNLGIFDLNFVVATGGSKVVINQTTSSKELTISFKKEIVKRIEESDASDEKKHEAKSKLEDFLSHPFLNTIIGGALGAIL